VRNLVTLVALMVLCACSGTTTSQADCDKIASDIRTAAIKRGYDGDGDGDGRPDALGVCGSTNAQIQKDFGKACADLKACNGSVP